MILFLIADAPLASRISIFKGAGIGKRYSKAIQRIEYKKCNSLKPPWDLGQAYMENSINSVVFEIE